MDYNYRQEVYEDIIDAVKDGYTAEDFSGMSKDEIREKLYDELWIDDGVTGNASGSYFFNSYKAEEAICHNLELLADAMDEFGRNMDVIKDGAEACDVTIRCYVLGEVLDEAIDELEEDGFFNFDD